MRTFDSVAAMQDCLITRHNARVKPDDKVYFLGDFAMHRKGIALASRFNGQKRLIRGNHDIFPTKDYLPFFKEIYATRIVDRQFLLSHIPIREEEIPAWGWNVHGHTHNNHPADHYGSKYINVSIEMIDYTPINLDELRAWAKRLEV